MDQSRPIRPYHVSKVSLSHRQRERERETERKRDRAYITICNFVNCTHFSLFVLLWHQVESSHTSATLSNFNIINILILYITLSNKHYNISHTLIKCFHLSVDVGFSCILSLLLSFTSSPIFTHLFHALFNLSYSVIPAPHILSLYCSTSVLQQFLCLFHELLCTQMVPELFEFYLHNVKHFPFGHKVRLNN